MSSYASGTKLTDLALTDEPALDVKPRVAEGGFPSPVAFTDPTIHRSNQSTVVKAAVPKLADEAAVPIEVPTVDAVAKSAADSAARERVSRSADDHLAEATREFDNGKIDKPLWARAMELAENDVDAAKPGYLRARATALRISNQKKRAEMLARLRSNLPGEEETPPEAPPQTAPRSKRNLVIAGALGCVVVVGGFLALRPAAEPPARVALSAALGVKAPQKVGATPAPANKGPERTRESNDDFAKKVADLKAAGNWNVLVLYGVEWTRKIPESADAWNELGMGYAKLRQFSEAQEATAKAAQLAPNNFETWQRLGEIGMALQQPVAALAAYERAVALNGRDVTSLVQIGALNAQLGHLPEASAAFVRALEVSPMDADALCGAASAAQKEGRAKDADALARQLKSANLSCREAVTVAPVSVPTAPVANKKPAARPTR